MTVESWLTEAEDRYERAAGALARSRERGYLAGPPELLYDANGAPIDAPLAQAAASIALAHELLEARKRVEEAAR